MHREVPEFKRCCFCLPLRRGLIAWGYVKLILNLLTIAYTLTLVSWIARSIRGFDLAQIIIITVTIILLLTDLSFDIVFIVASHKKSIKLLKVSYIYNLVCLGLVLAGNCFLMYVNFSFAYRLWQYETYRKYVILDFAYSTGLSLSVIFVQIYLILLIRSELAKLRKQTLEIQFSNHLVTGEPQCTLHNASVANQCEGKTQVAQVSTGKSQVVQD